VELFERPARGPPGLQLTLFIELPLLLAKDRNLPARIPVAEMPEGAGFAAAAPSQ